MCTVTIIPLFDAHGERRTGFRLVASRDEQRDRTPARPPEHHHLRDHDGQHVRALWPIDPVGGGTWIAATDRGVALTVLNVNLDPSPKLPETRRSRGTVIPTIAHAATAERAIQHAAELDLAQYAPFRLVAADDGEVIDARWDREQLRITRHAPESPVDPGPCFASSGLGDELVTPRVGLWKRWFARRPVHPDAQDAYHDHAWPELEAISVRMSRSAAHTVSVTAVDIRRDDAVAMTYRSDLDRAAARLALRPKAAAPVN
jgi:hypothetical protein